MPDAKRRGRAEGGMDATGETLGSPPAINVATVSANHEHIQTVTSNAPMPMSRHAWVRYRGAAAINHLTVRPPAGHGRDSAVPKMPSERRGRSARAAPRQCKHVVGELNKCRVQVAAHGHDSHSIGQPFHTLTVTGGE